MGDGFRWSGRILRIEDMDAWAVSLPKQAKPGTRAFSNAFWVSVIQYFLGKNWYEKYACLHSERSSFLFPNFEEEDGGSKYSMHMHHLTEMLLNLQHVEGFRNPLSQLAGG